MLANSFINRFKYGCKYNHSLEENINNNCPKLFEKEMRVPEFYLQSISLLLKTKIKTQKINKYFMKTTYFLIGFI